MQIIDCFSQGRCVFSIEVFPPKKNGVATPQALFGTLESMSALKPDFISVTYGAGGTQADNATCEIAAHLKNTLGVEPLAHLTCVNATRVQITAALDALAAHGVANILALRGDLPADGGTPRELAHASELAALIRAHGGFNIVGACYPEGHIESENLRADVAALRYKTDAGVTHFISQLFFDNGCYFRLLNMLRKAGISAPVQAGVMPIVNARQIERTISLTSASLPERFTKMISRYADKPEALFDAGIDYAIEQLRGLMIGGADGVHLYAMNNAEVARRVHDGIADLL